MPDTSYRPELLLLFAIGILESGIGTVTSNPGRVERDQEGG